jgi:cytochrome c-type biogenesis protein CcmH/NrfF
MHLGATQKTHFESSGTARCCNCSLVKLRAGPRSSAITVLALNYQRKSFATQPYSSLFDYQKGKQYHRLTKMLQSLIHRNSSFDSILATLAGSARVEVQRRI